MLSPDQLRSIPLLRGMSDAQLEQLSGVFERRDLPGGTTLFQSGQPASSFFVLAAGEVAIYEGDEQRYVLRPPAPIGELGALAHLNRNTTARVTQIPPRI